MTVADPEPTLDAPQRTWVIVAGGFHQRGGMDKANAALAGFLVARGDTVHLVTHAVDAELSTRPGVHVHLVRRPLDSVLLGGPALRRRGRQLAAALERKQLAPRVIVNGGNCDAPGVNWVHSVHAAWPCVDRGAPLWFRAKNRVFKALARRDERRAFRSARCIIANSAATREALLARYPLDPERVHVVYLGADPVVRRPQPHPTAEPAEPRTVVFVGALSHDDNKGLDTVCRAWELVTRDPAWNARLLVVGGGNALAAWKRRVADTRWAQSVSFLGFRTDVETLLQRADLLVSPSRYEAYGLNVQEALLHGVPVIASAQAGIAERFPAGTEAMLLHDVESAEQLAGRLRDWRAREPAWRAMAEVLADVLQQQSWPAMAAAIVRLAEAEGGARRTGDTGTAG